MALKQGAAHQRVQGVGEGGVERGAALLNTVGLGVRGLGAGAGVSDITWQAKDDPD